MFSSPTGPRFALIVALNLAPIFAVSVTCVRHARADGPPIAIPTFGEPALDPPPDPNARRIRFFAIPNVAYDTDDGLGFGARAELALVAPGYAPYKAAFVVHAFASLRGYQHHRFRLDFPNLGPSGRMRFTAHIAWRQWQNDGYWGIGNTTTREREFVQDFSDDDPRRKRYRYSLFQPFIHTTLRTDLRKHFYMFQSLNVKYSIVQTYAGSLLEEQRPYGIDGGLGVILSTGLLYDTRSPEVNPSRGALVELSGRVALPMPSGAGFFGGALFSARGFVSPTKWLTFAGRYMVEALFGDIPFYEMVHWGGAIPVAGFGGSEGVRGLNFGRYHAPTKMVLNLEARIRMFGHGLFGRQLDWQLGLFADAGMALGAPDNTPSGGWPVHPGFGAGLRLVFDQIFVGRFDVGYGIDPIRDADGKVTNEPNLGLYVVFDQAF